jgi:hypothetical protein
LNMGLSAELRACLLRIGGFTRFVLQEHVSPQLWRGRGEGQHFFTTGGRLQAAPIPCKVSICPEVMV